MGLKLSLKDLGLADDAGLGIRIPDAVGKSVPASAKTFLDQLAGGASKATPAVPDAEPVKPPDGPQAKKGRRGKYHNVKTWYDGILYDSQGEAGRAATLDRLMDTGVIVFWKPKPGNWYLGCPENVYRPDFLVVGSDGDVWAEDWKGVETAKFRKDKRLWKKYATIPLRILTPDGKTEVVVPERDYRARRTANLK